MAQSQTEPAQASHEPKPIYLIRKRDGNQAEYEPRKIKDAIRRAWASIDPELTSFTKYYKEKLVSQVLEPLEAELSEGTEVGVEEIQDKVENFLWTIKDKKIYDAFVKYRTSHAIAREARDMSLLRSLTACERTDITSDNANMNTFTPSGMMNKFGSEYSKALAKKYLISPEFVSAMDQNYIYIHDLDYYSTRALNCLQAPLDKVLENGMNVDHGSARPAKRIETAAVMVCMCLQTTQNEMYGGQAIPAFDFYMAPYVRLTLNEETNKVGLSPEDTETLYKKYIVRDYDPDSIPDGTFETPFKTALSRTIRRVYQAMEGLVHNLNTIHSRGGNQTVFSSLNYGTDTSPEGRLVIRELLRTTMSGVGNGATAIFPIQIWKAKAGVSKNPGDQNYDLYQYSWSVCARRFFPNYLNLDSSFNYDPLWDPSDPKRYLHEVATMGCRTRVYTSGPDHEYKTSVGRGNLSFTTLNLPKLAIEAAISNGYLQKTETGYGFNPEKNTESDKQWRIDTFYRSLHQEISLAGAQLDERYRFQARALVKQFPLVMSGLWEGSEKLRPEDTIESIMSIGTLGVGFIGLAEALIALTGKHQGESESAQALGLQIIEDINNNCKRLSETYKHNYSCFATPAEGLSGRFTEKDIETFGLIEGITALEGERKDFYTNSNHVPVWYHTTATHKAQVEGPYHKLTPGGHIFYTECDYDITKNPEAVRDICEAAYASDCGYISINHNQSRCTHCSFESNDPVTDVTNSGQCPICGSKMSSLSRVTGYLSSTFERQTFGKQAEIKHRVTHDGLRHSDFEHDS